MRASGGLALLSLGALATAASAAERPTLTAGRIEGSLRVDGRLNEPGWAAAEMIPDLTMVEPTSGARPSARTVVRVLARPDGVAIGVVCYDPDPAGIVSYTKERDGSLDAEDHLKLVLDPFRDGRAGYVFALNPGGARYDALVSAGGGSENPDWDGIWDASTTRHAEGWTAEIWIPIRTLSFPPDAQAWYVNFQRRIQRLQETARWASPSLDYAITQTSRAGELVGLPRFDLGLGVTLRPALIGGFGSPEPEAATEAQADAALDLTQRLGPNLLASLTLNTDFAETEVDTRQTNLTRFPLFFPEKRTFFLEGSDVFEFGLGLDTAVVPFFSRRIGLVQGQEVPILAGLKLNGRAGDATGIGAIAVRTREKEGLAPAATLGVLRVKRNVLSESWVGLLATAGDPLGRGGSWLGGVDLTYRTSRLGGDKNLQVGLWGLALGREGLDGDRSAVGLKIDYPNDLWQAFLVYRRIGEAFQPSLGFVARPGVQQLEGKLDFKPRPRWRAVRQMFFELRPTLVADLGGRWQSYSVQLAPVNWRFESGDRVELNLKPQGERLLEPFEIAPGVVIPPGRYHWLRYRVEAEAAAKRKLAGQATWWFGSFYEGSLHEIDLSAAWTPVPLLTLQLAADLNFARLPQGDFEKNLLGLRLRLNLSPDLQLRSFLQYDNETRSLGTNTRLRWTFRPEGALFVVYNHNLRRFGERFERASNELLVKLQYALRR